MVAAAHADAPCAVARAAAAIGDAWSLLIVRDALLGQERFDGFARSLGISRNALTQRLSALVAAGILTREPLAAGRRQAYRLTPAGRDLAPLISALMAWGAAHRFPGGFHPPWERSRAAG